MKRQFLTGLAAIAVHCAFSQAPSENPVPAVAAGPGLLEKGTMPAIDLLYMPSPYSYRHLGLFCKAEVKVNRFLPFPVMFRLGDVEHAQELEGKGVLRGLQSTTEP
ncbi:MAG: hypothetical protein ABI599_15915 [Flavobacteriales bacterium]